MSLSYWKVFGKLFLLFQFHGRSAEDIFSILMRFPHTLIPPAIKNESYNSLEMNLYYVHFVRVNDNILISIFDSFRPCKIKVRKMKKNKTKISHSKFIHQIQWRNQFFNAVAVYNIVILILWEIRAVLFHSLISLYFVEFGYIWWWV